MRSANKLTVSSDSTPFERITASYFEEDESLLSEKDQELKHRWESAFSLLLNFHSREQAVKKLQGMFDISRVTAYRDIANALSLFGDIHKSRKEGWRYVIFEYNMTLLQIATKDKSLDIMGKCIDRMIKLADLDKEESSFNPEKLKAMNIEISIPAATQKALNKIINKGVVDFNAFQAEDIPYTEVKDEEGSKS